MKHTLTFLTALLLAPLAVLHAAELKLAALFTDHMIVQRDAAVPVWGWANPGEEVSVEFADQRKTAKADAAGKWMVEFAPMPASAEPRVMKFGARVIKDVLIGDVWLCSGQSNMNVPLRNANNGEGTSAVLTFTHAEGLAAKDGALTGFVIAGEDGHFQSAQAVIVGTLVRVSSPAVPKPVAVRYAWSNNLQCSLVNGAGLPAPPFRFPMK